jgi:hypothetical protein
MNVMLQAGIAFDPCYHAGLRHLRRRERQRARHDRARRMTDAIAHAILTFATTSSAVQGTGRASDNATRYDPTFRGSRAIK